MGTLSIAWRGADLADDEDYQARLRAGEFEEALQQSALDADRRKAGRGSCMIFLGTVALIVTIGIWPELRPVYAEVAGGAPLRVDMAPAIMILMLACAGVIGLVYRADPATAVRGGLMRSGLVAIISILGVSWLGSSFFTANEQQIVGTIESVMETAPWLFAVGLFVLSILLFSQAATVVILAPVGVALGMPAHMLVGLYPAVNSNFFLPTYGTVVAAISFDRTGTTRIGKYVLNHSFMRPGLVATGSATLMAMAISSIVMG
jgi:anaerobic C4-dicarboxylate transporter DcuA